MATADARNGRALRLDHPDGRWIGARVFEGRGAGWVVLAGATAAPQGYYRPLAAWLAERVGVNAVTLDYRGVGASRDRPLPKEPADYRDWAADVARAIDHAADQGPTVVVGHSFGGHAFGMTDAHRRTRGLYTFGTGAGWHGYMPAGEALKVWSLWNVLGPLLVAWRGYPPMSAIGLGEDLPRGVYRDWKRWCSSRRYFFDDPDAEFTSRFAEVEAPVVGVNSADDPWAPPVSARVFLSHYPHVDLVTVDPRDHGYETIGHMGYVRPSRDRLWAPLAAWVEARLAGD